MNQSTVTRINEVKTRIRNLEAIQWRLMNNGQAICHANWREHDNTKATQEGRK